MDKTYDYSFAGGLIFPTSTPVETFTRQLKRVAKMEIKARKNAGSSLVPIYNLFLEEAARAAGFSSWGFMLSALLKKNDRVFADDEKKIVRSMLPMLEFASPQLAYYLAINWCKEVYIYSVDFDSMHPPQKSGQSPLTPGLINYLKTMFTSEIAQKTCAKLEKERHWIEEELILPGING
ncbi:hypothetical protein ACFP4H_17665 [Pseudophaeobacter arcticus]|uniref:hypothetical protein n=1 Tax=Pseudophaeobacter arcticus TaxID=385492 RepID=UPI000489B551|nr:hypothetical protein [Pseudophaeobacter arcticus]